MHFCGLGAFDERVNPDMVMGLWALGWCIWVCPTTTTRSCFIQDPDKRWLAHSACEESRTADNFIYFPLFHKVIRDLKDGKTFFNCEGGAGSW